MNEIELNQAQKEAKEYCDGPLRIIAGPGSGKTRTIISKIGYILKNKIAEPWEILTITFTNKAALEIKERVEQEINQKATNIFTYHGWCNYFLRNEAEETNFSKDFMILDSSDRDKKVNDLIKVNDLPLEKNEVINAFDQIARDEIHLNDLSSQSIPYLKDIFRLWEKFQKHKQENDQMDFNDLLLEVKNLLVKNKTVAEKWKNKYKFIFIDEFQDTNNIQFEIIKAITDKDSKITVVGDPDQNIYSWRGANIDLINNFKRWFPTEKTIFLESNYRSTPQIIEASNSLIKNNLNRVETFFSSPIKNKGRDIQLIKEDSEIGEAFSVARKINELIDRRFCNYHDIAIIVRSSYKTRVIESALNNQNIPYRVIGAMKFFDRSEVKQTLKFLLFAVKQNNATLLEVINNPPKKFGPKKVQDTKWKADQEGLTIWEYLNKNKDKQSKDIQNFIQSSNEMINGIKNNQEPSYVLEKFLEDINYIKRMFDEPNRTNNIKETLSMLRNTLSKNKDISIEERIISFINRATLSNSADKSTAEGDVNIITAHASKGTEFPVVFVFSMNEGHIPSTRSIENNEIEEERRIAYVAITRAKELLIITNSHGYTNYGKEISPSRFINELFAVNNYNYKEDIIKPFLEEGEWEVNNKDFANPGRKIWHQIYGEGIILQNDLEFITVEFENNQVEEILLGHKSYKLFQKK